jgi:hypothetical protein
MNTRFIAIFLLATLTPIDLTASEAAGPTANFLSEISIDGLKQGITENQNASEKLRACILDLKGSSISQDMEMYLSSRMTQRELTLVDSFISSDLGKVFTSYALDNGRQQHGRGLEKPLVLSMEHIRGLEEFGKTEHGKKFVEIYTNESQDPLDSALLRVVDSCKRNAN